MTMAMTRMQRVMTRLIAVGSVITAPFAASIGCNAPAKIDPAKLIFVECPGKDDKVTAEMAYRKQCNIDSGTALTELQNAEIAKLKLAVVQLPKDSGYCFVRSALVNCAPVAGAPTAPTAPAATGSAAPVVACADAGVTYIPISIADAEQGSDVTIPIPTGKTFNKPVLIDDAHHAGFALKNDGGVWKLTVPFIPADQKATGKHVFIITDSNDHFELTIVNIKPKRATGGHTTPADGGFTKPPVVVDNSNPLGKPATIENPDKGK